MILRAVLATALVLAGCEQAPSTPAPQPTADARYGPDRQLTDADLVAFDRSPWGDEEKRGDTPWIRELGVHNGTRVVADYPCGDICPDYTQRIVHYDAKPGVECDKAGGVTRTRWVPGGAAMFEETFCFPAAIAGPANEGDG